MSAAFRLPEYLRPETRYGVVVCTEHRLSYIVANIDEHLSRKHGLKGQHKRKVLEALEALDFNPEMVQPADYSPPIPGLQVLTGYQCNVGACTRLSQSLELIDRHRSRDHGLNSKRRRSESGCVSQVLMQCWFAKSNKYWIVDLASTDQGISTTLNLPRPSLSLHSSPTVSRPSLHSTSSFLSQRFADLKEKERLQRNVLEEPEHTAELTPWDRISRYREHLLHIDLDLIPSVYLVPRKVDDHPVLFFICESIERVLSGAHRELRHLHVVDAKRLNSFQVGTIRQDPMNVHQSATSIKQYISSWKRLLCYFYRVRVDDPDILCCETSMA